MNLTNLVRIFCFIFYLSMVDGAFPCSAQYTMKPTGNAKPQNIEENPPPFKFAVFNSKGEQAKLYKDENYTIKLTADETFFRGFLIQARLSTRQGFIIGHLRSGEFLPDSNWDEQGVQIQNCPPILNDSLTNKGDEKKLEIQARWMPHGNDGPIQFVLTVVQESDLYWHQWSPESGLLLPDKAAKFTEQVSLPKSLIVDKTKKGSETKFIAASSSSNGSDVNLVEFEKVLQQHPSAKASYTESTPTKQVSSKKIKLRTKTTTTEQVSKTTTEQVSTTITTNEQPDGGDEENFSTIDVHLVKVDNLPPFVDPGVKISQSKSTKGNEKILPPPQLPLKNVKESATKNSSASAADSDKSSRDYCTSAPCVNNGTCKNLPDADRYECHCVSPWGGLDCKEQDYCTNNDCKNSATCVSGEGNYTCQCASNWAGKYCQLACPADVCKNEATCTIDASNHYQCLCRPGFTGAKCETNIDECASNPCYNNATCIDKDDAFECQCHEGFMGERCHRPCQDIYHSCQFWQEQDRCESQRPSTKFFDINCASTCGQCVYQNSTISTVTPLPPLLEPFEFLLGKWVINFSDPTRYPVDFGQSSIGYYEEIQFIVPPVNMFGTPSINYSAIAVNNADPHDIQKNVGFLTLSPVFKPIKVSIMSTGNDGLTLIEEGEMTGGTMKLQAEYLVLNPLIKLKEPKLLKREFSIQGSYLQESVSRTNAAGEPSSFTKYYSKQSSIISYL